MSFKELKDSVCEKAILKWKRFLRATEKPTVKAKSDLALSLCADEETKVDLVDVNIDSEISLRDLVATFVVISFVCSLLRTLFGRK